MRSTTFYNLNAKLNIIKYGALCAYAVSQIKRKVIPVRKHRVMKTCRRQVKRPANEYAVCNRLKRASWQYKI
jgi:hypothetical protein